MAINIFKMFGEIDLKDLGSEKIDQFTNKGKQAATSLSGTLREFGNWANQTGTMMMGLGAKVTAGVTVPVVGALTAAVKGFANLEQAVGGVETMFKSSASTVISNAENAYKTAGISAVDYMDQVTSFSATLLQGLGGDTVAAAKYADMAIVDMADNANKFGTNIRDIQNAYQGFAKDNYTMLDNLKLGRKTIAEYKPSENGETLVLCA